MNPYNMTQDMKMNRLKMMKGKDMNQLHTMFKTTLYKLSLTLLLLIAGANGAWAQTDHSGTYFIANGNGYSSTNIANNFYLVPATNSNYGNDANKPHLTTSKTGQVLNCCWQVVKSGDYYRIIHVADGKYLTANPAYSDTSGNDVGRLRVHLEEMATPDDNTLFEIKENSNGGYNIRHKDMTDKINNSTTTYLDPAGGNVNGTNLTNTRTATTSSGKINVGGGIGYWTDEAAARWRFEPVPQNNTYTYNIVDRSGRIAIKYTTGADQPAAKALSSYTDIPAAIRSPYLNGETVKFYTFSDSFSTPAELLGLLTDENKITATPVNDGANIYVTYTTDHLSERFVKLHGASAFNITINSKCIYDNSGLTAETSDFSATTTTKNHIWHFMGDDPYAVQVKNLDSGKSLEYNTTGPTLSVATNPTNKYFIIMDGSSSGAGIANGQMELMAATGDATYYRVKNDGSLNIDNSTATGNASLQVRAYPVSVSNRYHLIDKAGKLIEGNIESESSELGLPDEWKSPLVSAYHYRKDATLSGNTPGSSCDFTGASPVTSPFDATDIYVTYDVGNAIDLTGGKTYLLKFLYGVNFNQEDGVDGVNTTATKAIYPYNNGDFNLYVYGQEQWISQLAKGASTRTRWLWYFVSSNNGTPLTGANIDPYHVIVKSHQEQLIKAQKGEENEHKFIGHTYLRTYKPDNYASVVTGVSYENEEYNQYYSGIMPTSMVNGEPTEYMILGTSISNMKLKTVNQVDGSRRVVDSFEQYWKNNPTARDILNAADKSVGSQPVTYELSSDQKALLTAKGWHTYECWANAAPWNNESTGGKTLANGKHWFQTISMGTGDNAGKFTVEQVDLAPQVILLDQHGWEIMHAPLSETATLSKYNSPMVATYHWYPTATKVTGYHKYTVSGDPTHESTSLSNTPDGATDFYVTYTVNDAFARNYQGAATEEAVSPSTYLVKQGGNYATYSGSGTTIDTKDTKPDRENVSDEILWNLKPNFNIDREMGYKYAGETGATSDAQSKAALEANYYSNGQNGFDPYNVQIQNKKYQQRYFTADTSSPALDGGTWTGTSSTVTLQNMGTKQTADGYDQTTLNITNATFMVVDDGAGNMRLMPRFDHGKVMQSFGTLEAQAAAATANDQGAGTQTLYVELVSQAKEIHSSDEITDMNGNYLLAEDFSFSGFTSLGTSTAPFTGIIDGQLNTLAGQSVPLPLVAYADGAIIRNVIFDNVSVSSAVTFEVDNNNKTAIGAIAGVATGKTRIYNCGILATNSTVKTNEDGYTEITSCSSSVGGTADYVGGLVGFLDGEARVINCYSYANITGGTTVGGIVGYNNVATTSSNLKTMVMNCMYYGNITSGNKAPIYNGQIITNRGDNSGVGNYNYFYSEAPYAENRQINTPNCALMAEGRFLQRFEFFRHLLNSHRELAGWWATGTYSKDEMAKWVLEPSQIGTATPYPILKQPGYYPSVVNIDADNATTQTERNKGGKLGTLTVNIQMGDGAVYQRPTDAAITTSQLTLNISDKDPDHFNFNYYKVQLPYYNDVGTNNYNGNRVVTGWKIVSITGGTAGTYSTGEDVTYTDGELTATPYNFADRNCTNKDLYGTGGSNRIFNQGAYWDVPEGVSAITIEPYWAKCAYLADPNADKVYSTDMKTGYDVSNVGGGQIYTNGNSYNIAGDNQKVFTTMSNAIASSNSGLFAGVTTTNHTPYDYAVVLVGNYHNYNSIEAGSGKPFTVTSIDLDGDNEPDYSYILRFDSRKALHPVRVDFINIPGLGMAQKSTGGTGSYNFGIFQPKYWFESTNTSLFRVTQFEYDKSDRVAAPYIVQGGVIEQWVSGQSGGAANKTTYFHVGGNVWFKEFHRGTHQDYQLQSKHPPVSVTGGDYDEFYLTGLYRGDVDNGEDNAECYINGGRFGTVCGAAQEGIGKANGADNTGNVIWQVQNADIREFYAGGLNADKPVTGNLSTTIVGSHVDVFCGGPKFGDMSTGKTVTTVATDCTFGTFFGAGYGGNSYSRQAPRNHNNIINFPHNDKDAGNDDTWNAWLARFYTQEYNSTYGGVSTQFSYQFLPMSGNADNVARIFVEYVKFSLATTHNVTSTLTGCTITGNFYGGGSLGKVEGNVSSTLTNCTVKGNVFGAGFSAQLPNVEVDSIGFRTEPWYYTDFGTYRTGEKGKTTTYTWNQGSSISIDKDKHILYTTENLAKSNLGSVEGNVTLTIQTEADKTTTIGTAGDSNTGNVFGGGEESYVTNKTGIHNVTVNIKGPGNTNILGSVFGGGDEGNVEGNTKVNVEYEETPEP